MSSPFDIGPARADEVHDLAAIAGWAFTPSPADMLPWFEKIGLPSIRVIREDARSVGMLSIIRMGQWFGGVSVPCAGIGAVAVSAHHRGRGVATRLMQAALREIRDAGMSLSALYPATQPLYRAVGYELAGTRFEVTLPADAIDIKDRGLELRPATDSDRPAMEAAYARRARWSPGNLDRDHYLWDRVLHPRGEPPLSFLILGPAGVEGYVVISKAAPGTIPSDFVVHDVVAGTPAAARRLLSFFADHRSVAKNIIWFGPPSDPLLAALREQPYTVKVRFQWMVRIVDVISALEQRGYPRSAEGELHLMVDDPLLPENNGCFLLEVAGGKGSVRRSGRGTFRVHVRGLAPLYTGFQTPEAVRVAGLLEAEECDLGVAAELFAGPAPWMSDMF
ncbi:MAG: GNAT family N-acetyltransferase [Candidatus Eisenbacteria bacterium]|nr:GNAT family N-acetyltransferase [Candidatus Eisenbacteria bacterium]